MSETWKRRIYSLVIGSLLVVAVSGCKASHRQPVVGEKISAEVMGLPEPTLSVKATLPAEPVTMPETTAAESPEAMYEPSVTEEPAKIPTPTPSVVTLCLTGDLMCLGGQQNAAAKKGGGYDFSGSFALIKDYLQGGDFAIGNLETVISPGFPYTAQMKYVEEDCPNCNAPPEYLEAVRDAGFVEGTAGLFWMQQRLTHVMCLVT